MEEEKGLSKCRKDKDHDLWYGPGPPAEFRRVSCAVCRTGVGSNRIFCNASSGIKCLAKDPDYSCTQRQGLDGRPQREVQVKPIELEVVASSCYLGDMLSASRWL